MSENLQKIIDRVKAGNHTQEDVLAIVSEISGRKLVLASGSGAVAIGGDAANARIATGNQNVIGDRNTVIYIDGIESQVIQSVVDRYSGINSTFQKLFPPSASSAVDWDWGMKLLKQKQLPEIRKRLTDNLGRDRILMDVSIEERQNWVNRSPLAADRTLQINGKDCGTLDANKMLIETFGRDDIEGKLLILGAPGAGKTTALLSLAEQLVEGAISQPRTVIPVIFELSTWRDDNQSIQDWLIEQLYGLHGGNRKSKLYEKWLERQVLLPLLDGLDELGLERQKKCTEKLNEFAEHYPQLVVCCRVKEFEAVDIKLRNLRGAVSLQSLSDSQIQHYLSSLNRLELWEAIQTTPSLQAMLETTTEGDPGLLRVPLFVKLVADVYDRQQPISSKADLLDKYIDRQLSFDKREIDRRKGLNEHKWAYQTAKLEPDWKKTRSNLNWISRNLQANNKVEFLIEHMQPSSINFPRHQYCYRLFFGFIFGLSTSLINVMINLAFESTKDFNIRFVLVRSLAYIFLFGMSFVMVGKSSNILKNSTIGLIIGLIIGGLFFGMFSPIILEIKMLSKSLALGIFAGVAIGFLGNLINIYPIELFQLSISNIAIKKIVKDLRFSLIYGSAAGLITGSFTALWMGMNGITESFIATSLPLIKNIDEPVRATIFFIVYGVTSSFFGLVAGLVCGIIYGLIDGAKQELKVRSHPNQGIWNSLLNQFLTTVMIFPIIILLFLPLSGLQYWKAALFIALFLGFAIGGGKACLQHLSLRIVLWQSGLPWNFARFLNYCVERRLLLRVGGSYRFLHRELLDHFAQSSR